MFDVALNVLPIFLMILIGWAVVASGYLKPEAGVALSEFVFKLAVPVLIFRTLAEADFHGAFPVRLWIAYFAGVAVTWSVGHVMASRLFGTDQRTATVAGVSAAFANNVFIGLPLVDRLVGPKGLVAISILIAVHLPVMMIASSLLIERAERRDIGKQSEGWYALLRYLGLNLSRNPLVFGVLGGIIWHFSGFPLTGVPKIVADQLAAVAAPAALLSLGMAMRRYGLGGNPALASMSSVLKLFLLPACVLVFAKLLGLSREWQAALVLTSSVPTGINAWLIAAQFRTAEKLAASTITLTTGFGVLTVMFWAWMVG
jgi:malonate transporter and related proteins